MARKSRELRLSQTKTLVDEYEKAGLSADKNCSFARDMIRLLERKKALSPRRRAWLDAIIEEGVPAPKGDPKLLLRINHAREVAGMTSRNVQVLTDFAGKIRKGWKLSEKQERWMHAILDEADRLRVEGAYMPDPEIIEKLKICIKMGKSRSAWYWEHKPGETRAYQMVEAWLRNNEYAITEHAVNKCLHSFRGGLRKLSTGARHQVGDMVYHKSYDPLTREQKILSAIIVEGPYVSERGDIVYDALAGAEVVTRGEFPKRRPKETL